MNGFNLLALTFAFVSAHCSLLIGGQFDYGHCDLLKIERDLKVLLAPISTETGKPDWTKAHGGLVEKYGAHGAWSTWLDDKELPKFYAIGLSRDGENSALLDHTGGLYKVQIYKKQIMDIDIACKYRAYSVWGYSVQVVPFLFPKAV